jgi:hypothetical protein
MKITIRFLLFFGALGILSEAIAAAAKRNPSAAATESIGRVNAERVLVERPQSLIGANIEDLNFQLYYVDRMFADEWLPLVVPADCPDSRLDVLAKKSRDGQVLTIYLVKLADSPVDASLQIEGFGPRTARVTRIGSEQLEARKSPENPANVVSRQVAWSWISARPRIELPARSFTSVRLSE